MPNIRLHHQVCAFIDVLGGARLFRGKDRQRAREFFSCLDVFEQRMNGWSGHFPKKRQTRALVKTFSDNIFVAFPLRSNPKLTNERVVAMFLTELTDQIAQLTLMSRFPLRGAVTVGPLMFSEKFLFGPALVEAVELEKAAVFPRIMLSKSVLRHITPDSPYQSLVLRDADGSAFLDYLGRKALIPSAIKWHREFVQKGLAENASRVRERQKYEWLAQYHNFHAMKVGMSDQCVSIDRGIAFEPYGDEVDVISPVKQRRSVSATGRSQE